MTMNDFDRTARLWLEDGPTQMSDRALSAALDEIHVTRQRRAWWPARRFSSMPTMIRLAAVVGAIVLAIAGISLVAPGGGTGGPSRTATPTPSPRVLGPIASDGTFPALQPGSYVSTDPFPIRVTATVPAGWNGGIGGPYALDLQRSAGGEVFFSIFDKVYADPCHLDRGLLSPLPGPSVDALATALSNLPSIAGTTPAAVTLAGYQGKQLTLTAPADVTGCNLAPHGTFRIWELPLGATFDLEPGQVDRVWILDVGGQRLVIDSPASQTTVEGTEVQTVIDSIRLAPASPPTPSPS